MGPSHGRSTNDSFKVVNYAKEDIKNDDVS